MVSTCCKPVSFLYASVLRFSDSVNKVLNMHPDDEKELFNLEMESAPSQFQTHRMPVVNMMLDEKTQTMQEDIPTVCMHIKGILILIFCQY